MNNSECDDNEEVLLYPSSHVGIQNEFCSLNINSDISKYIVILYRSAVIYQMRIKKMVLNLPLKKGLDVMGCIPHRCSKWFWS